jgi:hypothetical protein
MLVSDIGGHRMADRSEKLSVPLSPALVQFLRDRAREQDRPVASVIRRLIAKEARRAGVEIEQERAA